MNADGSNRRRVYEGDVDVRGYDSVGRGIKVPGGVGMAVLSPDGSKIAFVRKDGYWVMDANGSGVQQIMVVAEEWKINVYSRVAWAPDSKQIICGKGYIVKIPGGSPQPIGGWGDWSPDGGWFAYNHNQGLVKREVWGGPLFVLDSNASQWEGQPAWSPDGTRIVYTKSGDIFVINADGSGQTRLTDHPAGDWEPRWSPDGGKIIFTSDRDGNREIYVMNPDGSNPINLTNSAENEEQPSWSP